MSNINLGQYDLVMIDGPWQHQGRFTPSICRVYDEIISRSSIVVVDDSQRKVESGIVQMAKDIYRLYDLCVIQDEKYPKRFTTFINAVDQ